MFWRTKYYPDPTTALHLPTKLIHGTKPYEPLWNARFKVISVLGFKLAEGYDEVAYERIRGG